MRFNITHVKGGMTPETADRVSIGMDRGGFYSWHGLIFVQGQAICGGSPPDFRTIHDAQVDAVSWAMAHGVTSLFIEGDGE